MIKMHSHSNTSVENDGKMKIQQLSVNVFLENILLMLKFIGLTIKDSTILFSEHTQNMHLNWKKLSRLSFQIS